MPRPYGSHKGCPYKAVRSRCPKRATPFGFWAFLSSCRGVEGFGNARDQDDFKAFDAPAE